ncbi:MAG: hypothetical protein JWQ69_5741 [Pseudomonas sp.]|nr:hypothetical protein [Pseudomonas sp.]
MEQGRNLGYPAMVLANRMANVFTLSGEPLSLLSTPMNSGNCWLNARWATAAPLNASIAAFPAICLQSPCAA